MNYIADVFIDRAFIKNFQNIFSASLNCLYNLIYVISSQPQIYCTPSHTFFSQFFFFVAPLPLSYRHGKFCTSSSVRSSETASRCSVKFRKFQLESLFNKVAGLKVCGFIKKRLQHRCFPMKFAKFLFFKKIISYEILKNTYFEEHLQTTTSSSSSFKLDNNGNKFWIFFRRSLPPSIQNYIFLWLYFSFI